MSNLMRAALLALLTALTLSGCAVVAVGSAAVSVAATAVKTTAKVAGAVVSAAIPDGDDKKDDTEKATE